MSEFSDRIIATIKNEAYVLGLDMVADIKRKIATGVVRDDAGNVIQRSDPGEYPWLETGHLQASEHHEVQSTANTVVLTIINDALYARRLHDGHGNVAPRPFHDLALPEWVPQIRERIRDAITLRR